MASTTRRRPGAIQEDADQSSHPSRARSDDALSATRFLPADWHLAAVEHAADAIVVADLDGRIQYANPTFVRDVGVERNCLIGQAAPWLAVAEASVTAPTSALWSAIRRGDVWRGQLTNRGSDGTLAHAEATAAPVRDGAGAVVGVVAIMRDTSSQRALDAGVEGSRLERTALVAALGTMRSGDAPGATGAAILLALLGFHAFGIVGIFGFEPGGGIIPLATLDRAGRPLVLPGSLPTKRCAYLRERASKGPWIENWNPGTDHPYRDATAELGLGIVAYMPIRSEDVVLGLLVVGTETGAQLELAAWLPALVECAAMAGALLGPQVRSRNVQTLSKVRIRAMIADRAFLPVFQPIVELASRTVVGYEALTRFADGSRPDEVFAAAARCGLAIELEAATLQAALDASGPLPGAAWLNLNVSAELVLAGEPLASLLRHQRWQIVLELTEHIEVTDYAALRAALERLGPTVRLAVDDAGAGFASLRHILELNPDYVKLDRGIVHGVDGDPARQALIAGMVHFATKTRAVLIAEGVETEGEARQVRQLGVALGQGYRLGRPALAGRIAAPLAQAALPAGQAAARQVRPARPTSDEGTIGHAVNIGEILAAALREAGVATVADLRALGAVAAWERLRATTPRLATAATLLQLEGATRGRRVTQLPPAERARLRLFVRLHHQASSA